MGTVFFRNFQSIQFFLKRINKMWLFLSKIFFFQQFERLTKDHTIFPPIINKFVSHHMNLGFYLSSFWKEVFGISESAEIFDACHFLYSYYNLLFFNTLLFKIYTILRYWLSDVIAYFFWFKLFHKDKNKTTFSSCKIWNSFTAIFLKIIHYKKMILSLAIF